MLDFNLFFLKIMLWSSIPLVFGFEYWEHFLSVSTNIHIVFQVMILVLTLKWVLFWDRKLMEYELELSYKRWDSSRDSIDRELGKKK